MATSIAFQQKILDGEIVSPFGGFHFSGESNDATAAGDDVLNSKWDSFVVRAEDGNSCHGWSPLPYLGRTLTIVPHCCL